MGGLEPSDMDAARLSDSQDPPDSLRFCADSICRTVSRRLHQDHVISALEIDSRSIIRQRQHQDWQLVLRVAVGES